MEQRAALTKKVYKGPDKSQALYYEFVERFHRTVNTANNCNNYSVLKTVFCRRTLQSRNLSNVTQFSVRLNSSKLHKTVKGEVNKITKSYLPSKKNGCQQHQNNYSHYIDKYHGKVWLKNFISFAEINLSRT